MSTVLLIDNYDSFVHNLSRYVRELGMETVVARNDRLTLDEISCLSPSAIILSPGPCTPREAGISVPVVERFAGQIPILGVCLGHQAIACAYNCDVIRAREPIHGHASWVRHQGTPLFAGVASPFQAARYHSLVIDAAQLPPQISVTAATLDGVPMAIEHDSAMVYGLQFHPESVLTQFGHQLLANFLRLAGLCPSTNVNFDLQIASQLPETVSGPTVSPVAWPAPLIDVSRSGGADREFPDSTRFPEPGDL